jgi:hypothetical protein
MSKIRRAERLGYRVHPFALANHVHDVHAIKTSMAVRSGGPVLARWLLRPEHIGRQAEQAQPWRAPACDTHWTVWWGVFIDTPGHRNGPLETAERLVAYTKLARSGELVHYLDLMGHRDHLADGVMLLMHVHIARWLLGAETPPARGARAIWYGALEHGGEGLLTWKRRAGFAPGRLATVKVSGTRHGDLLFLSVSDTRAASLQAVPAVRMGVRHLDAACQLAIADAVVQAGNWRRWREFSKPRSRDACSVPATARLRGLTETRVWSASMGGALCTTK